MRRKLKAVVALSLLLALLSNTVWAATVPVGDKPSNSKPRIASALDPSSYVPGEVLVIYKPGVSAATKSRSAQSAGAVQAIEAHPVLGLSKLKLRTGLGVADALAYLSKDPNVLIAQPNYIYQSTNEWQAAATRQISSLAVPDDVYYPYQGGLSTIGIRWAEVYDALTTNPPTPPSQPVKVAVVDTGVDYTHPDLTGQVLAGYDFVDNDSDPMDANGHGTHVAGIIAATTDNGIGVAGVAGMVYARILPVRVLDAGGNGTSASVVNGIYWAVDNGADIINLSLGSTSYDPAEELAIAYAQANDVLVVAAAGNGSTNAAIRPPCRAWSRSVP